MTGKVIKLGVDLATAVIVSIFLFVCSPIQVATFGIAYAFLMLSILIQVVPILMLDDKKELANKTALYTLSIIYIAIQFVISITAIYVFPSSQIKTLAVSLILVLVYIVIMATVWVITSQGENRTRKEKDKVLFIDKIVCTLENCRQYVSETVLLSSLNELIELAKYSDIMSSDKLADIELQIYQSVDYLEELIKNSKFNDSRNECEKIKKLFAERNLKCKLYK